MKVATFNINNINRRLPNLLRWLRAAKPDAVALQDKASMARANGVGPKLAARIVAELAGKPPPRGFLAHASAAPLGKPVSEAPQPAARGDAVSALINLGIEQSAALRAVAAAMKGFKAEPPAPDLIRAALKEVNR